MRALGKVEAVLGALLSMQIVRIVGNYFVIKPNVMEKAMTSLFLNSAYLTDLTGALFNAHLVSSVMVL
jgi:hypothetical protein